MKIEYLLHYGEVISELESPNHYSSLFLLSNFFVQTQLDKQENEITAFSIVKDPDALYSYVSGLDLGSCTRV